MALEGLCNPAPLHACDRATWHRHRLRYRLKYSRPLSKSAPPAHRFYSLDRSKLVGQSMLLSSDLANPRHGLCPSSTATRALVKPYIFSWASSLNARHDGDTVVGTCCLRRTVDCVVG